LCKVFIRGGLGWYFEGKVLITKTLICKVLLQIELRAVARGSRGDLEERLFRGHNTILRD
jgi:hypothetical protein